MKNKIEELREALRRLGFVTSDDSDEDWYSFVYSNITYKFTVDENRDFLAMGIAFYQEHDGVDPSKILEVINRVNDRLNYVKVILMGSVFWLTYEMNVEHRLPTEEELRNMIVALKGGYYHLRVVYREVVGDDEAASQGAYDWDGFVNQIKG